MGNKIKAIIFDGGRTLHDPETDALFDGVPALLENLSKRYKLVLISLAKSDSSTNRRQKIETSGCGKNFQQILVGNVLQPIAWKQLSK